MKTSAFAYARAETAADALRLWAEAGEGARYIAGGQSLMAALNFRLDQPAALIDISRIAGLRGITVEDDRVVIGALTRHAEVAASPIVARHLPLIAEAVQQVAHPAIRNRGTFGGSVALADPAAEMPACALALGATVRVLGQRGPRLEPIDGFFRGTYETALSPGELLTHVEIPIPGTGARHAFAELSRRHGDYAMAGVAVMRSEAVTRVVLFAVSDRPVRSLAAEAALAAGAGPAAVAAHATEGIEVYGDLNATAETKRHLAGVLLRRALAGLVANGAAA